MPCLPSCRCGGSCPGAGLCHAAGAEQLVLSEDGVNFVPRKSSGTAAVAKVGQQ